MPRNSSGTYALPAGNPVVTNTLIQSTWANTTLSDVSTAMTDSLDRNGRGAMLAPLKNVDGSAVAPSLSFSSEGTMGIYRASAGVLGFAVGGALVLSLTSTGLTFTTPLVLPIGSAAAPSLTFTANTNTGIYSPGTNQFAISTNGAQRLGVDAAGTVNFVAGNLLLQATGANTIEASSGTGTLVFQTGGANTRFTIDQAGGGLFAGNFGIGITPAVKLHVQGADIRFQDAAGLMQADIQPNVTAGEYRTSSFVAAGSFMTFYTNPNAGGTQERMRIDAAGRVGIGRVPTTQALEIAGSASTVVSGAADTSFGANVSGVSTVAIGANNSGSTNALGAPTGTAYVGVAGTGIPLVFTTGSNERLRIDSSGNLGIGASSPTAKLDVRGNIVAISTAPGNPIVAIEKTDSGTANQGGGLLEFINLHANNTGRNGDVISGKLLWQFSQPTSGAAQDAAAITVASDGSQGGTNTQSYMAFATTPSASTTATERMRIDSLGNVGIGRAPTATLDVFLASGNPTLTLTGSGAYSSIFTMGASGGGSAQIKSGAALLFFTAGNQVGQFDSNGAFVIGNISPTAKLTVLSSSSAAASAGTWGLGYSNFGPNTNSSTGAAFAIGYNNTLDQSELLSLAPGTAWKPMRFFGAQFSWIYGGTNTAMTIGTTGVISDATAELGWKDIPQNAQTGAYVLVLADRGKSITITTGGVTVPNAIFGAGNVVTITNNSGSSQTITQGASFTLHQSGTTNTGNRTLLPWGIATVEFLSSSVGIITGNIT